MSSADITVHPFYQQVDWPGGKLLMDAARQGVPYDFLIMLNAYYHFTNDQWASILYLSDRTLFRYEKEGKSFPSPQSEKLLKLCLLLKIGLRNLKDLHSFRAWLNLPNRVLGNVTPLSCLDTFSGTEMVIAVLIRAEYGVLS